MILSATEPSTFLLHLLCVCALKRKCLSCGEKPCCLNCQIRMLTLIWVILLLADKGSGTQCSNSNSSITLSKRNVSAQVGLCVVLACPFTTDDGDFESITWYKHDGNVNKTIFDSSNNTKADSEFKGRVSLFESDLKNKNCSIIINDLTKSDSGSYQVVFKTETPCTLISDANVTVTVTELSERPTLEIPEITEGQQTTLTCSAPGLCNGSTITWIWSGSGQSVYEIKENNTEFKSKNQTGFKSTLTFNASAKHNGQVTCKVTFKSVTTNETKTLNVKYAPRILNDSNCSAQSKVLTCVCISEGFPSPTIKWPHLENHTEYCVTTNVSNTSVTSTITVSQDHCQNTTIECVSSNSIGNTSSNLSIITNKSPSKKDTENNDIFKQFLTIIRDLKVIIAVLTGFVIGIILSTVIACLITKSRRKKWKRSANMSENLEMVTTEAGPTMDADQAATYAGIREPEDAEGEAESVAQLPSNGNCRTEVEYSDINFSALRPKNPEEAQNTQDATDTEYAEIKREELRQEDAQEDSEMLEANEENELMSKKDNEEGEDVALYSSVEELMG